MLHMPSQQKGNCSSDSLAFMRLSDMNHLRKTIPDNRSMDLPCERRLTSNAQVDVGDLIAADAMHAQDGAGAAAAAGQRAQLRACGMHLRSHCLQRCQGLLQIRLGEAPWKAVVLHT